MPWARLTGFTQLTVAGREATEARTRGFARLTVDAGGARGGDGQAHRFMTTAVGAAQLTVAGREERGSTSNKIVPSRVIPHRRPDKERIQI
jgi:hypothetical protein